MSKPTHIHVEIIKEIEKAFLVRDSAGREAWIKRRSYLPGGMVVAATFEARLRAKEPWHSHRAETLAPRTITPGGWLLPPSDEQYSD